MALTTSSHFASVIESGTDWRDTSKKVLEALESVRTAEAQFNFGFLYVSDMLADDLSSITNLFKSVLNIESWVGSVGIGVCGNGEEYIDKPAISAMIGHFPEDQFTLFPPMDLNDSKVQDALKPWLDKNDPMLVMAHGSPDADVDPAHTLKNLDQITGGFIVGGLASSRTEYGEIAGDIYEEGIGGAVFSADIPVASALSQGCVPVGPTHTITRGTEHTIVELDKKRAIDVFEKDMRDMVMQKIGKDPEDILVDENAVNNPEEVPEEFRGLFKGEMHIAFPVSESDQRDYLVRNVMGLDESNGTMDVAQNVHQGERAMFVYRDDETVREDLSRMLVNLRKRVERDHGNFAPKAAIYVSCLARAFCNFDASVQKKEGVSGEMKLIHEVIGDVPLSGFYASGEISNARLYGYTGILTLFL